MIPLAKGTLSKCIFSFLVIGVLVAMVYAGAHHHVEALNYGSSGLDSLAFRTESTHHDICHWAHHDPQTTHLCGPIVAVTYRPHPQPGRCLGLMGQFLGGILISQSSPHSNSLSTLAHRQNVVDDQLLSSLSSVRLLI